MNALPQENQSNLLHLINRGSEALPTVIVALTILFLTHYAANGNRRMSTVAFFTKCMSTRYQVFGPYFVPGYSHIKEFLQKNRRWSLAFLSSS